MKLEVTTTSQDMPTLAWSQYNKLKADKADRTFQLTLQNLSEFDVYIEKEADATEAAWYKLFANSEVEIITSNIELLNFISVGWTADVRFISL